MSEEQKVQEQQQPQEQQIDYDALSRPEGAEALPSDIATQAKEPEVHPPTLPGADMTKQIGLELNQPESAESENETHIGQPVNPDQPTPETSGEQQAPESPYGQLFNQLKERLGDGYQIPEDINPDNALEHINDAVLQSIKWDEVFDPRVLELQQKIDSGARFEDLLQSSNPNEMTGDALLKEYYKDRYGLTDDNVGEYTDAIDNRKLAELEAKQYFQHRNQIEASQRQQQEQAQMAQQQQAQKQQFESEINDTVAKFQNLNDIYNIPLDAKHKGEFEQVFRKWVTPGTKGEPAPLSALLSDNDQLAKIIFLAEYGGDPIKEAIFKAKDGVKRDLQGKLDVRPQVPNSTRRAQPVREIDFDKLVAPAND